MLPTLLSFLPFVKDWLSHIKQNQQEKEKHSEEAINALYIALSETNIYIGRFARHSLSGRTMRQRSREKEAELSRLWTNTALKMRHCNPELADRCMVKGLYWSDPEQWSQEEIKDARIQISQVFREARAMIYQS